VHDEGPGIAPELLPNATERFHQDETSRTGAGAGLALSLVEPIVAAHGWQLRLCSAAHHDLSPHAWLSAAPCHQPEIGITATLVLPAREGGR
jgi:signal transduction histidine kinase